MLIDPGKLVPDLRNRSQVPQEQWRVPSSCPVAHLIPHRAPFKFIDRIEHFDRDAQLLVASYRVRKDASTFRGHFPQQPIFPGTLLIEAMGQAGACLASLFREDVEEGRPLLVRVHHALFLAPVYPDDTLVIEVGLLEGDNLRAITTARVHRRFDLCAIAILETHYVGR
ncbi:MAG: hypothetical protein ABJD53_14540 [Gammaproteobacteria bacterium]